MTKLNILDIIATEKPIIFVITKQLENLPKNQIILYFFVETPTAAITMLNCEYE